jgi:hypothetical protein
MTDTGAGRKSRNWLWAALAALLLIAVAAWAVNRGAGTGEVDRNADTTLAEEAANPAAQMDASGTQMGQAAPPAPSAAAAALDDDGGRGTNSTGVADASSYNPNGQGGAPSGPGNPTNAQGTPTDMATSGVQPGGQRNP